jgi:lipoate-protein ligase A
MHLFHHTYPTPEENIAIDEQLLKKVNQGEYPGGILRLWESSTYFVVLGLSKTVEDDVNEVACNDNGIPILKRCSGGGTVLQGPGCFNYGYILPINHAPALKSLTDTTSFILHKVKDSLSPAISGIELKGISDLAINDIKFSGNAQRRLKNAILFHGTILYDFDLSLISNYLKEPPVQPEYRNQRNHGEFVNNIAINKDELVQLFVNRDAFIPLLIDDV